MIRLRNLTVSYGNIPALNELSLTLPDQGLAVVAGPEGAGKTSLWRALHGELVPDSGDVVLDGCPLRVWPRKKLALRRAALEQDIPRGLACPVRDVVRMGRLVHAGMPSWHNACIADQAMAAAGVRDLAGRCFPGLALGEQRRVLLAQAMAQIWEPPAPGALRDLWLDEPFLGIDLAAQCRLLGMLKRFAASGVSVLCFVPDLFPAAAYADSLVILREGEVVAHGAPSQVLTGNLLQSVYGGDSWTPELAACGTTM